MEWEEKFSFRQNYGVLPDAAHEVVTFFSDFGAKVHRSNIAGKLATSWWTNGLRHLLCSPNCIAEAAGAFVASGLIQAQRYAEPEGSS